MSETVDEKTSVDGRVARRQRNIDAVLDVVLQMFAEEALFPTMEQAATRSGLSLRSLYRYFADPAELLEAIIVRSRAQGEALVRLHAIGEGPFVERLDDFIATRLRLYDAIGPVFRATIANAARHQRVRDELARNRSDLRDQFELQFAPELATLKSAPRQAALSAGDLVTQLDSIDYLRRDRDLSAADTRGVLESTLTALLT